MKSPVGKDAATRLTSLQHELYTADVPVLIIVEGGGGRLLGRLCNEVMNLLEPRGVEYHKYCPRKDSSTPRIALSFLAATPANGKIGLFDRGWYTTIMRADPKGAFDNMYVRHFMQFERYLTVNGVILIKIFIDYDEDIMRGMASELGYDGVTDCGAITSEDGDTGERRDDWLKLVSLTDTANEPWDVVSATDIAGTVSEMVRVIIGRMSHRLQYPVFDDEPWDSDSYPNPRKGVDLTTEVPKGRYGDMIDDRSRRIAELQCAMSRERKSLALVFEGWDAAGKGGSIKRLARALSPRAYRAVSYGVPTDAERAHTYMWRFASAVPEPGNVTIFDRSWYGRMMVEPIEGFCTSDEYARAAKEINLFERSMAAGGITVLKFWLEISPEEQLMRFKSRESDPLKSWKITSEDWRNRAKWDEYDEYVDRMMERTNTPWAPWIVISAEDKKNARIEVMDAVIRALEGALGK